MRFSFLYAGAAVPPWSGEPRLPDATGMDGNRAKHEQAIVDPLKPCPAQPSGQVGGARKCGE
jgi:hypothetical protein